MMWSARTERLDSGRVIRFAIEADSTPVAHSDVLRCWRDDAGFRSFFIGLLADAPFAAYRWETPPTTAATANRPFEFVLLDSPCLARNPEIDAFGEHFRSAPPGGVVEFPNLGKDAIMVVPCPGGAISAYGHLGAFVRQAPEAQQHTLWAQVGATMQRRLSAKPVWLSTAGAGIAWLHVRLDDRPKYYGYAPYRRDV
jgi:hypothetical protein